MWLLVSVSSTRIDHDARGLTARGALFAAKRVSFFWTVVSQLSRGLLEGVRRAAPVLHHCLVKPLHPLAQSGDIALGAGIPRTRKAKELSASARR